jgi:hypothetical protein
MATHQVNEPGFIDREADVAKVRSDGVLNESLGGKGVPEGIGTFSRHGAIGDA